MWKRTPVLRLLAKALLAVGTAGACLPCSVLSHEAIVDAAWDTKLEPLLRAKFPDASAEELKTAHGYAYGGSIIQDLGYYPHGSKQFSDLTHYVKSGDFVMALIAEAGDLNELAFALGALSHYSSDSDVHRFATNPGEAILYPKLERKFGPVVTYEQDPGAHLKTEFGFDVLEVAKANYAPEAYHNFIGFAVETPLLGRAVQRTYGLELSEFFQNADRTIGSFRRAVSKTIPEATRIAWAERQDDIKKLQGGVTRSKFVYSMSRSSYERDWGVQYDRPTVRDRLVARLLKLVPPIGPLRALRFRMPTPEVEKLFVESFSRSLTAYNSQLDAVRTASLKLPNVNYDLGEMAKPGVYGLQDETYAFWLDELAKKRFEPVTSEWRKEILSYFQTDAPLRAIKDEGARARVASELNELREVTRPASAPAGKTRGE